MGGSRLYGLIQLYRQIMEENDHKSDKKLIETFTITNLSLKIKENSQNDIALW